MIKHIKRPAIIKSAGNMPKIIEEYFGAVNTQTVSVSIARMQNPGGWSEPGQTPEFDEYTVVLKGVLTIETNDQSLDVKAGEAVIVPRGEWVNYSYPHPDGAEYRAIYLPAFSPETVHRDE